MGPERYDRVLKGEVLPGVTTGQINGAMPGARHPAPPQPALIIRDDLVSKAENPGIKTYTPKRSGAESAGQAGTGMKTYTRKPAAKKPAAGPDPAFAGLKAGEGYQDSGEGTAKTEVHGKEMTVTAPRRKLKGAAAAKEAIANAPKTPRGKQLTTQSFGEGGHREFSTSGSKVHTETVQAKTKPKNSVLL